MTCVFFFSTFHLYPDKVPTVSSVSIRYVNVIAGSLKYIMTSSANNDILYSSSPIFFPANVMTLPYPLTKGFNIESKKEGGEGTPVGLVPLSRLQKLDRLPLVVSNILTVRL